MTRSFPPAREGLKGLAVTLVTVLTMGLACDPDNSVKDGAPVLTQFVLVDSGGHATSITGATPDCPVGTTDASACAPPVPAMPPAPAVPGDTMCRQLAEMNFCTCAPDAMDPTMGTWGCPQFASITSVIAIFDRLLDGTVLDPGDAPGLMDVVTVTPGAGAPTFDTVTDYSSSGTPMGLIPLLGGLFFGNHRLPGPSLLTVAMPSFPSGTSITIALNPANVRAKDGHTAFTGEGLLQDGELTFTMAPFAASVSVPDPAMPDMTPVTVGFTNLVDAEMIVSHVHVTSNGAPFNAVTVTSDGASATVTPTTTWPASATIVVSVDATAQNLHGQTIAAAASAMFMTAAM